MPFEKVCSGSNVIHFVKPEPPPTAKAKTLCGLKLEKVRSWEAGKGPEVCCKTCEKLAPQYDEKA